MSPTISFAIGFTAGMSSISFGLLVAIHGHVKYVADTIRKELSQ